jgi:hypothetical protein
MLRSDIVFHETAVHTRNSLQANHLEKAKEQRRVRPIGDSQLGGFALATNTFEVHLFLSFSMAPSPHS